MAGNSGKIAEKIFGHLTTFAVIAAVVLVILFYNGMSCDSKRWYNFDKPEDTTRKFIERMAEADFDGMKKYTQDKSSLASNYQLFYAKLNAQEKDIFKAQMKRLLDSAKITSGEVKPGGINDHGEVVTVTVTFEGETVSFLLIRKMSWFPWYIKDVTFYKPMLKKQ